MKRIAVAVAAIAWAIPVLASAQFANRVHQPVPPVTHERYEMLPSHGSTQPFTMRDHGQYGPHRHRVTAIIVYVPAIGSVNVPYYYAPSAPFYVDRDPPWDAYRDANGFYYWCPDPAGYYPEPGDCPLGWRLVP